MSNYINEALLDASPMKKQQAEAKGLVTKWEKTGLLDGLNEEFQRSSMATLLENQAKQLINEFSKTSPSAGSAGGNYKGDEEWSGVALPLVRRIFGEIAAQEFVSVQPMNLPSGLVFYLDFQHGKTRGGFTQGDSIHGNTGPFSPSGSSTPYPDKGFYGTGKYGYTVGTGSAQTLNVTGSAASMADINYDSDNSGSGFVVVKKSTHFSASAYYALQASDQDMIGFSSTSTSSTMVPTRGKNPFLGTNAITFSFPCEGEDPVCLDMATTQIAWNWVLKARAEGKKLDSPWAINKEGFPTDDPNKAIGLLPAGLHKGYGLGLVVEILCNILANQPYGKNVSDMFDGDLSEIISALEKSLSSDSDIAPQVYLLNELKLIDFSGLTSKSHIIDAIKKELESVSKACVIIESKK